MKKNLKIAKEKIAKPGSKGITLIALVVTIVVLLILAGITINAVLSDGGIFNTAKNAENVQQHASVKEKVQVMLADAQLEKLVNNKTLQAYLEEQGYTATEDETAGTVKVAVDGYEATVNEATLEITKIEKFIPVAVTGVSFKQSSGTVVLGYNTTLTAEVTPENASNKRITYTSSNPAVATVNNGQIQGLTEGTTIITATTADGSFTATCDITVADPVIVSTTEEITTAIRNTTDTSITIGVNGEVVLPTQLNVNTTITDMKFVGLNENSALKFSETSHMSDGGYCVYADNINLCFEDIKIVAHNNNYIGFVRTLSQTYKNCTIENMLTLLSLSDVEFENCVFNGIENNYCIWTYHADEATFTNCIFNSQGKAINVYAEASRRTYSKCQQL